MVSAKNAIGTDMPFQYDQYIEATDGYNLILTIDEDRAEHRGEAPCGGP